MADYKIKVSIEEMEATINKFETCKAEMAAAYGQMSAEVLSLNSTWNGEASQAFVDRFSELTANLKTSDATVDQAVNGLKAAIEIYSETEADNAEGFSSMTDASPFG